MNSIEGGTYEIIQSRLAAQKKDLQDRLGRLDAERKKIFGSIESKLIANNRIITDNNCISSDMVAIGDFCIFGYNVHFGLRTEIKIEDVFSIVRYAAGEFKNLSLDVIRDDVFTLDFVNLYKYYRNTKFNNFFVRGNYLYMIFQLSTSVTDLKAFKWLIKDNTLTYIDNRSEHEYRFPNQHDFNWQYSTRDMYRYGKHSHVSILDKVFVDTINGDLAIKVENNTEKGQGILSEPVIHPDQTLDDGEYRFADLGNLIALAIKPFQEETRYFIYNHKLKEVEKIDSLKDTAILLPDNQGLIFSNGYYLQTGEHKVFEHRFANINFHERIASPNGEDFIYVFYEEKEGHYVLMSYNTISQEVKTPIICNGFSILKDGELCYFQSEDTQTKNHVVQIWQTPFIKGDIMPSQFKDTFIYKIGNKDIVRGMSDCYSIINLLNKEDNYEGLYSDLTHLSQNILDKYYWITHPETFELNIPLTDIKTTANVAIDEFEKVVELRRIAEELTHTIQEKLSTLFGKIKNSPLNNIDTFVHNLSELRSLRGELISLKEVRYVDPQFITQSESEIIEQTQKVSLYCVEFLLDDKAFAPYHQRVAEKQKELEKISKVVDGKRLAAEVNQITADLEMLIEIVSNLNIEDTSHSTAIIDAISLIFATLNQLKAGIKNKIASLGSQEANLDFVAQVKLIDQSIVSYLDMATSPEKVDELLNKIALQLEDLEARFSDHEQFIETIIEKREEIYAAFDNQKANLIENRNKKSIAIDSASQRILKGVRVKALTFGSVEEINAYFASDLMISKLGELMAQLHDLDDVGKAESIGTELKSAKEDALRRLKDKQDLYEDGENIIRLGKHKFAVNKQALDLTIVMKGDGLKYHLTGTDFYQDLHNDTLLESKKYWNQELVSENNLVYRSAYLAYVVFKSHPIQDLLIPSDDLQVLVQQQINKSYTEGYIKGVHDHDALLILKTLINKHHTLGMLRFSSRQRAFAQFFWYSLDAEEQRSINDKIKASGEVLAVFPNSKDYAYLITILEDKIKRFAKKNPLFTDRNLSVPIISRYLCEEFRNDDAFAVSIRANQLLDLFLKEMSNKGASVKFKYNLDHAPDLENKIQRTVHWVASYLNEQKIERDFEYLFEVVALLLFKTEAREKIINISPMETIEGLIGSHPSINQGNYAFDYHKFIRLLDEFVSVEVPAFEQYRHERHEVTLSLKKQLRLNEFQPKVLTSFVRNKLIDQVYLPLFGNNLAKQLGSAGTDSRTDRSGMLLLVSPPGYGKTTLMEYLANRLGLVFMKINGPAIGHQVTSVDPDSATNSAAREELKKLNLALEMGNNVMLYLDDIQHCHPELLQKFISLADGTRKIEGIYNGQAKTYDMKSKKFCIIMAGNPYTETGEKFRIPDMLANRADIYNLGDVIGNTQSLFELSLIENALTSNTILTQLINRNFDDLYTFVNMVEQQNQNGQDFKGNHSKQEIETYAAMLDKVIKVRNVVLKVNAQYIASAAMEDDYRVEPAFKLQGSYRDMNKLVAGISPIMNDAEVSQLLLTHYTSESQILTSSAEGNMLKYKEICNILTDDEQRRWTDIKATFVKNNKLKAFGNQNDMALMLSQLMEFTHQVEGIKQVLSERLK